MSEAAELTASAAFHQRSLRSAWYAVVARFLVHGLVTSTWISRIPAIQGELHLNNAQLGLSLLGAAVGSLTGIPICGWLVSRYGTSRITSATAVGFCFSLALPGLAVNAFTLFLALAVYGAMAGANDVAMNSQGVAVENAMGRPTISRFHAMFSIGGMIGAAAGGAVAARHVGPELHLAVGGLISLLISLAATPLMRDLPQGGAGGASSSHRLAFRSIPPVLLALCAVGFCMFLSEGAMADWIAVYLKQVLNAGQGLAAAGYAVFSAGMAIFRLLGDAITVRLGPGRTVRAGAVVAACGLTFALLMRSPMWALPGFAITGAGFSVIIPLIFAAGGRIRGISPGAGIATVSGLGYLGFLFGPPAIGIVSQLTSLRYALFLIVGLTVFAAWLSSAVDRVNSER